MNFIKRRLTARIAHSLTADRVTALIENTRGKKDSFYCLVQIICCSTVILKNPLLAMFYVICFDISDDRGRYRAVKAIKGLGSRVQKSIFEFPNLTEKQLLVLKDKLEALIDHHTDSIRYYRLCRACLAEVEWSGKGEPPQTDNFLVL